MEHYCMEHYCMEHYCMEHYCIEHYCIKTTVWNTVCLAGAVDNVAGSDRCRCNPKVPSSIPTGGKDFP